MSRIGSAYYDINNRPRPSSRPFNELFPASPKPPPTSQEINDYSMAHPTPPSAISNMARGLPGMPELRSKSPSSPTMRTGQVGGGVMSPQMATTQSPTRALSPQLYIPPAPHGAVSQSQNPLQSEQALYSIWNNNGRDPHVFAELAGKYGINPQQAADFHERFSRMPAQGFKTINNPDVPGNFTGFVNLPGGPAYVDRGRRAGFDVTRGTLGSDAHVYSPTMRLPDQSANMPGYTPMTPSGAYRPDVPTGPKASPEELATNRASYIQRQNDFEAGRGARADAYNTKQAAEDQQIQDIKNRETPQQRQDRLDAENTATARGSSSSTENARIRAEGGIEQQRMRGEVSAAANRSREQMNSDQLDSQESRAKAANDVKIELETIRSKRPHGSTATPESRHNDRLAQMVERGISVGHFRTARDARDFYEANKMEEAGAGTQGAGGSGSGGNSSVVRSGTLNGKRVHELTDGTVVDEQGNPIQ